MLTDRTDEQTYREVRNFLLMEAELIDDGRFNEWLNLMTEDLTYRMPARVTRDKGSGPGFMSNTAHIDDDFYMLKKRIERLESEYAWAEDPPSRTRHFISNIRLSPADKEDEINVKSNLLLYRSRGDSPAYDLLSAERQDILRSVDGGWRLSQRVILVDQSTLATHNLSIFF